MSPKVAVVTGSNQGIGLAIIRGLCKRFDGVVYLTSLYEDQGADAIATLKKEGFHPKYHQLDITDIKSIIKFRDHIKETYEHIDLLVNNAAIAFKTNAPEPAAVQAEKTLHVNYFSTVVLCEVLFPLLRNGARVVNMSSSYGHLSRIPSEKLRDRLKDPNLTISQLSELMNDFVSAAKEGRQVREWGNSSYVVSKVGVAALTRVQQRLVNDRGKGRFGVKCS